MAKYSIGSDNVISEVQCELSVCFQVDHTIGSKEEILCGSETSLLPGVSAKDYLFSTGFLPKETLVQSFFDRS